VPATSKRTYYVKVDRQSETWARFKRAHDYSDVITVENQPELAPDGTYLVCSATGYIEQGRFILQPWQEDV
jgi:hypothetical protein